MNKKLLTVVVGAALSAGAMITAQADVVLYGHFHMSMDRIDNDTTKQSYMASNSTRFGIKGSEDLGGGMKAIYQMESGVFNADEGDGGLGATLRNTFMGLSGAWGSAKIGRTDTPTKTLYRKVDRFNEEVGDLRTTVGNKGNFDARVNNMAIYESPKIAGGLTFAALHTSNSGDEAAVNTADKVTSASVIWDKGPVFAGAAYQVQGNSTGTEDPSNIRLVGRFDFGMGDVGGLYDRSSDLSGVSGRDQDVYGIFGSVKIGGATRFKAHYVRAKDVDGTAATDGTKLYALGIDHNLGKKTRVYANYAKSSNDSGANYAVATGGAGHGDTLGATTGLDISGISVGMVIDF